MRKLCFAATLLGALAAMGFAAAAEDRCHVLQLLASVDMSFDATGGVTIPVQINGHPETLLVETGGVQSKLTDSTVTSLGLTRRFIPGMNIIMYGGAILDHYALVESVRLGTLTARDAVFVIYPDGHPASDEGGTLAPDFLRPYDVDFDFANAKFNLISKDHCEGKVIYWTKTPFARVPMNINREGHVEINVKLDGKNVGAVIDTGSSRSLMSLETAENIFGFDEKNADLKPVEHSGTTAHAYSYPFKTLALPGIVVNTPDIVLNPDKEAKLFEGRSTKLILGMGILRQLHLYIAYDEKAIYATAATAH